jgi:hypothetical protein
MRKAWLLFCVVGPMQQLTTCWAALIVYRGSMTEASFLHTAWLPQLVVCRWAYATVRQRSVRWYIMKVYWGQFPAQGFSAVLWFGVKSTIWQRSGRQTVCHGCVLTPVSAQSLLLCLPWCPCNHRVAQCIRRCRDSVLRLALASCAKRGCKYEQWWHMQAWGSVVRRTGCHGAC